VSQKDSGYARKPADFYVTPAWCTEAVLPHLRKGVVWEPAAGDGAMLRVLQTQFWTIGSDLSPADQGIHELDFLCPEAVLPKRCTAIVTNPPYYHAAEFCRQALRLMAPAGGQVAMLLRIDFDSGKTRRDLFELNPAWAMKIVLLDRIEWFKSESGKGGPSENHAWFVWDFRHEGWPQIRYARKEPEEF
jgi:hypothetical protein